MDFEKINCLICGSGDYETIATNGQFHLPTNVVICRKCGFSYLNPRWTKEKYNHFYSKEYDQYYRPEVYKSESEQSKFFAIKAIIKRLESNNLLPENPKKIIDIGSGMGYSLIYLKEKYFPKAEYFAIEPSEHCRNNLQLNNIKVITQDVDSFWELEHKNSFDLIIMRHVLEHFLFPIDILKKVSAILNPNGIVYIAVPNAMKPKKPMLSYYFRAVHVSYFSKQSLANAFSLAGLTLIKMIEGDSSDPYELYAVCKRSDGIGAIICREQNFIQQKNIYKQNIFFEPYYSVKKIIWNLIRLIYKK